MSEPISDGGELHDRLEYMVHFRTERAAEFPNDYRNAAAAKTCQRLANDLLQLPPMHPGMRRLEDQWERVTKLVDQTENLDSGEATEALIGAPILAIGFRGTPADSIDELIDHLTELAADFLEREASPPREQRLVPNDMAPVGPASWMALVSELVQATDPAAVRDVLESSQGAADRDQLTELVDDLLDSVSPEQRETIRRLALQVVEKS